MSQADYTTLMNCLCEIPDPRDPRGQRYEWSYLLTLAALALLAGQRSMRGMGQWVTERREALVEALAPKWRRTPSAITLSRILGDIDIDRLEACLGEYQQQLDGQDGVSGSVELADGRRLVGQSLDGKTLRGASKHGDDVHLVSRVRHESGIVLEQMRVPTKIDERKAAQRLLQGEYMGHTLTTLDALHTQTKLAEQILAQGGEYLMVVKQNQPTLYEQIETAFATLPPTHPADRRFWGYAIHRSTEKGHGRREQRMLERITALNDYVAWPGVQQVLRRTCWRHNPRTGVTEQHVHYAITSLSSQAITLAQLEQFWRWHWTIENVPHYIRDVSWGEDHCQVRTGNAPQALAALRNTLLGLLRLEGWPCIPTAQRHFDANLQHALRFIGALSS